MTKLEDEISSVRTLGHLVLAQFVLTEVQALVHAFKSYMTSTSPFTLLLFGIPLVLVLPYLINRQGTRLVKRIDDETTGLPIRLALTRQFATGAIFAYSLYMVTMGLVDLTTGLHG